MKEYTVLSVCCGIGGQAYGFQQARVEYRGMLGKFRTIAGIDCDPEACQDFEAITGAPAILMDLFTREQYTAFRGQEPPADWQEVTAEDILEATHGEHPDAIFMSPPCKGFSGLLPSEKSKSDKYQALNQLVIRCLQLMLDAYHDDLPAVIMIENVPRITSRGAFLIKQVEHLLSSYGYVFHRGTHDCGELGGLGQKRKRFLHLSRLPEKMPNFIYKPEIKRLKTIGDVIGPLPMPDDPTMGPMHRLPRLQWKTWVRLALIPAGGDWRDLENCGQYQIEHIKRGSGSMGVQNWDEPGHTVIGNAKVGGSSASTVSDPRLTDRDGRHPAVYQVVLWNEPGPCVTGTRFGSGAPAIEDPRTGFKDSTHHAIYQVSGFDETANTVTGAARPNNGAISITDPRVQTTLYPSSYGVNDWDQPAGTIRAAGRVMNAPVSIADPRVTKHGFSNCFQVNDWEKSSNTVTGIPDIQSGAPSISDPRLICKPRSGMMGVQSWDKPGATVIGAGDIHSCATAIADPRIPKDTEVLDPPPVIIAIDGTWHRPLTTMELAALQGFPMVMSDGRPLILVGNSDARWREKIGNAVPPPAAEAIAEEMLLSFLSSEFKEEWQLSSKGIWVVPVNEDIVPNTICN